MLCLLLRPRHPSADDSTAIFERFSDCIFILDMVASFFTTFARDGVMITSYKEVRARARCRLRLVERTHRGECVELWQLCHTGYGSPCSSPSQTVPLRLVHAAA